MIFLTGFMRLSIKGTMVHMMFIILYITRRSSWGADVFAV